MSDLNAGLIADGLVSVNEAVEFSRLSRAELYVLMGRNELAYLKHGKRRLIPKKALVDLLASKLTKG